MKLLKNLVLQYAVAGSLMVTSSGANAVQLVLDAAALVQALELYAQIEQEYEMLKNQYGQLKTLQNMASGSRGLGQILNDPNVTSSLPNDWTSVFASIKSTADFIAERAKYPTTTSQNLNAAYDQQAANNATMTIFYKKANGRIAQVKSLLTQIDLASDPAAKADLTSRLINEQNAISADRQLLELVKIKSEQDKANTSRAANVEHMCNEFGHTSC